MPSLYTGSPAASTVIATRRFPRPANTLNDELMLAIEARMRLLPRYWHKAEGLEELPKMGRRHLLDILLSNALRSIKDGKRGWSRNKFHMINMIYYCPGGNNTTFHSPKLQNKHGPIQCSINEGYVTGFDFQFIGEYPLKS